MTIQLRQVALVARELEPVLQDLTDVLGIERCYVDDGVATFGLENTLLPVGRDFLEVVAPAQEGTAAGRYLDRRGGDGGYMVICQADAEPVQLAAWERAREAGVRVAWEREDAGYRIMQLHPRDLIASFLEIDWEQRAELDGYWPPAGGSGWEGCVRTEVTRGFAGVELQSEDPHELAKLWAAVLGLPVGEAAGEPTVALPNATIRFVPVRDGRGAGLGGVDVAVADREHVLRRARERGAYVNDDTVMLCGTRFNLRC